MWKDPIVEETRKAGEKLSEEAGGDIKVYFANLRLKQEKYAERLAPNIPLKAETVHSSAVFREERRQT
jgi:hypothetical protein